MARFLETCRHWRWRLGVAGLLFTTIFIGAFGLLQTPIGRYWIAHALVAAASSPGSSVTIEGFGGLVPFHMTAERIAIADAGGVWLALTDIELDLSASELLAGEAHIRLLTAGRTDVFRWPATSSESRPLSEQLRVPHLPVPIQIDQFAIERLTLDQAMLGEPVEASLIGSALANGQTMLAKLDLHRSDGNSGSVAFRLGLSGTPAILSLRFAADEPTGAILDHLLQRTDRLPLSVSVIGDGPLTDWDGRLAVSAGALAHIDGDIALVGGADSSLSFSGAAAIERLFRSDIAPLIGKSVPIELRAKINKEDAIELGKLRLQLGSGTLTADGVLGNPDRTISGHLRAELPRLALVGGALGTSLTGSAIVNATISGTEDQPQLELDASGANIAAAVAGAEQADAHLTIGAKRDGGVDIAAQGQVRGIVLPDSTALPAGASREFSWLINARAEPEGRIIELKELAARGVGVDVAGSGHFDRGGAKVEGHLRLAIDDLRPFTSLSGRPLEGALVLDASAEHQHDQTTLTLDGSATRLRTGVPAIDGLTGGLVAISGSGQRDQEGVVRLETLHLSGPAASLQASGEFNPATRRLDAKLDGEVKDLQPLGVAMHAPLAGHVNARISAEGPLERLRLQTQVGGNEIAAGPALLDGFQLNGVIADLTAPQLAVTGEFRGGDVDGTVSLEAALSSGAEVVIRRLQVKAADSAIGGDLRLNLGSGLIRGNLGAKLPDLSRWSRFAGIPLAGSLNAKAALEAKGAQDIELSILGDRLATGTGEARFTIRHVLVKTHLADLLSTPTGNALVTLEDATFRSGTLVSASLKADSSRPGRFGFTGTAKGKIVDPLTLAFGGEVEIAAEPSQVDLRVARLTGSVGNDQFQLTRPLQLSKHGPDLALSDLALTIGPGQITAAAAQRGPGISMRLAARNLPIAPAARIAGYPNLGGTITLDANVGGTLTAPDGKFTLSGRSLRFAPPKQARVPALALEVNANWNGRDAALEGHVSGINGETIRFNGSAPLVLHGSPISITVPAGGQLTMRAQGAGELANLADLLPISEDKFTGRYGLDLSIRGTPANPAAAGSLTISDGRYENFATGAILSDITLNLVGDRDRLTVREFSAKDSAANGALSVQGSVGLSGSNPSAELTATLHHFRIAARDEAVVGASGTVAVTGALASPKVIAQLTAEDGEFTIPDRLPPSVTRLKVVEINSRAGRPAAAAAKAEPPAISATLDLDLMVPGRVFVRGRGLDSEWGGRIKVAGTSVAPHILGSLELRRGTFDVLGKSFKITRGRITFDDIGSVDPVLDLVAELVSGDVTAQVLVSGLSSNPTVTFASTPGLPQDEILARVLFNRSVGQITAAEGIQVAQAAATLAGGGPGMLDRLRGRLGLDRLLFGSAPAGVATSNLNPAAGGNPATSTAITGGKYVTEGVYVGATQGLTPQSGKVTVEMEMRPHVTIETDLSQTSGNGIGLNYKHDY